MAAQGGLVANAARRDVNAFDSIVEIQSTTTAAPAADLQPEGHRAFIQVKATQKRRGSLGLKLSNWKRMVEDASPWFVIVFEITETAEIEGAYVVHIDELLIEEALFALRSAAGPLHTIQKRIRYRAEHRLANVHGAELTARLLREIGPNPWEYQRKKRKAFETCGYGDSTHVAKITLPKQPRTQLINEWTNIALGKGGELRVDDLRLFDTRFGIAKLITSAQGGSVTWTPAPQHGTVFIEVRERAEWASAPVAIYSTSVIPGFPADATRLRVALGPLSLEIPLPPRQVIDASVKASVTWNEDAPHSVAIMALAAKVTRMMQQPGAALTLALDNGDPSRRLNMSLSGFSFHGADEMLELEYASAVAERVSLQHLKLNSFCVVSQRPRFALIDSVCRGEFGSMTMAIPAPSGAFERECAMITPILASFGEWGVVLCFAVIAHPTKEDGMLVFREGRVRMGGIWPVRVAEAAEFPLSDKIACLSRELDRDEPSVDTVFRPDDTRLGRRRGTHPQRASSK